MYMVMYGEYKPFACEDGQCVHPWRARRISHQETAFMAILLENALTLLAREVLVIPTDNTQKNILTTQSAEF